MYVSSFKSPEKINAIFRLDVDRVNSGEKINNIKIDGDTVFSDVTNDISVIKYKFNVPTSGLVEV